MQSYCANMVAKQRDCAAFDGSDDMPMQRKINEPTAAAIASGMDEKEDGECKELIYDLQNCPRTSKDSRV